MRPAWHQILFTPPWDWIAPPRCAACDALIAQAAEVFCARCSETLEPLPVRCCPRCCAPGWQGLCGRCRHGSVSFHTAHAAYLWGGELASALRRCKYGGRVELATPLGGLWAPLLQRVSAGVDGVIPVPLSAAGMRRRGFNQVQELIRGARRAGARLPPCWATVLVKRGDRPAQASLAPSERRRLPQRAFAVRRPARLRGRSVLLVDDVMTTGATATACASVLRRAGAARVEVVVLARAG